MKICELMDIGRKRLIQTTGVDFAEHDLLELVVE